LHVFIDFEASSLAKASYPVEVAWVFEDRRAESWLIRPIPAWTDWDTRAAAIHGISRATLESDGAPVEMLARHMLDTLAGHAVYASSPSWDGKWLSVLLRAGGLPRHALRLKDTDEAQLAAATEALAGVFGGEALAAEAAAIVARIRAVPEGPIAHRALPDALHELELWQAIRREALAVAGRGRP
jgi:hypothetical protein